MNHDGELMEKISRVKRWLMLLVVLCCGTALSAGVAYYAEEGTRKLQMNDLSASVDRWITIWEFTTDKEINSFRALASLFNNSPRVSQETFTSFTKNTLTYYPDLKQVFWVPKIALPQRAIVDAFLRRSESVSYIKDLDKSQGFLPASVRDTYYPILFNDGDSTALNYRGWAMGVFSPFSGVFNASEKQQVSMRFLPALGDVLQKNARPQFEMFLMKGMQKSTYVPTHPQAIAEQGYFGVLVDFSKIFRYFGDIPNIDKVQIHVTVLNDLNESVDIFKVLPVAGSLLPEYEIKRKFNAQAAQDWSISVVPTDAYFSAKSTLNQAIIFLGGMLTTMILLGYIYSVQQRALKIEEIVVARTRELQQVNAELDRLSNTDHLTGLFNRRYFEEALDKEWRRAIRENTSLTMMLIDIDYFKQYNDHYGHIEGDYCLQQVAKKLQDVINRPADVVARFGGEEFVILLPNTDERALMLAERCREEVEGLQMLHAKSDVSSYVTISVGIATVFPIASQPSRMLTKYADVALYRAKEQGRNRVFINDAVCEPLFV